jgi:hypothetical protein
MPIVPIGPQGAARLARVRFRLRWRRGRRILHRRLFRRGVVFKRQRLFRRRVFFGRWRLFQQPASDVPGSLLRVWAGHRGSIPAPHGQAGVLPRVLPTAANRGATAELQLLGLTKLRPGWAANRPPIFDCLCPWVLAESGWTRRAGTHPRPPPGEFPHPQPLSHSDGRGER